MRNQFPDSSINNQSAYRKGIEYGTLTRQQRSSALDCYTHAASSDGVFSASVSASICFVAGYLGKGYPAHDDRVIEGPVRNAEYAEDWNVCTTCGDVLVSSRVNAGYCRHHG